MTSDGRDRDVLATLVFQGRPSAPPGLDVRVLAIARARSRRRLAAVAAAGAVLASAVAVIVLHPAGPERAAPPAVVPEPAEPSTPAPADAAPPGPGTLWLDLPPWPPGDHLVLTWRISIPPGAREPAFGVELTATIGDVTRRVPLVVQFGWFVPRNQTFCAGQIRDGAPPPRLRKDELAAIAFGRPPDAGYSVRRTAAGDSLAIDAWTQRKGGCVLGNREYNPCPRSQHVVALMHTPLGIQAEQRIVTVDDTGDQPFRCSR